MNRSKCYRIGLVLCGDAVILEFHEQVVLAKDVLQPSSSFQRQTLIVGQQRLKHDATEAARALSVHA